MPPIKHKWASLLDYFRMSMEELASLTDWQIEELHLHKRDEQGRLEIPEPEPEEMGEDTEEAQIAALFRLARALKMPLPEVESARQKIQEKYRGRTPPG